MRITPRVLVLPAALAASLLVSCDAPTKAPTTGRIQPRFAMVTDPKSTAKLVALDGMRATLTVSGTSTIVTSANLTPPATPTGNWTGTLDAIDPGAYTLTLEGTVGSAIQHYARSQNPITVTAGATTQVPLAVAPVVPTVPTFTLSDTTDFSRTVTLGTSFALATGWQYEIADNAAFTSATAGTATTTSFVVTVPDVGTWFIRVRPTLPFTSFSQVVWSDAQSFTVTPSTGGRNQASAQAAALVSAVPDTIVDRNITPTFTEGWYVFPARAGDSLFATTRAAGLTPASPLNTIISIHRADGTLITSNDNISGSNTDSRDSTVAPATENYLVRVTRAGSTVGHYDVILELRRLPAAPTGIAVLATSATGARVRWNDNADNETSYRIERCEGAACTNFAELTPGAVNDTSFSEGGLTAGSTYRYRVRARNGVGNSAYAGPANVTLTGPTAPTGLVATTVSGSRIDLTWTDASDNETSFEIQRCSNGTCAGDVDFTFSAGVASGVQAYSNTGLAVDGTYVYRVRAVNNVAPSAFSATATANTIRPAAPTSLVATTISANQIDLAWHDNTAIETGFSIQRCSGQGCSSFAEIGTTTADDTTYSDATALPETFYAYRVYAANIAGNSASPSNTALANTRAPGVPASFGATVVSATRVDLSWSDTTAAETGFQVERCEGPTCTVFSALTTVAAGVTGYTDNTVVVGTSYRYRVRATGVAGNSPEAGPVLASILLPAAPTGLAAATVSGTQVNLSWTDASDNETTFRIERCTGAACSDFAEIGFVTAGTAAYNDQSVTVEGDYRYQVRSRNAVGNSVYSGIVGASTRSSTAPSLLTATLISATQIDLAWQDNSSNETGFRIERCSGAGCSNFAELTTVAANVQTYQNTGVTAGTSYSYRVRAVNIVAASAPTNTATASTAAPDAPSALAASTVTATRIDLSWTDGSTTETGFEVERCDAAGCVNFVPIDSVAAGVTAYVDAGLVAGSDYRYRVRAFNTIGASAYTAIVNADTRGPQAPSNLTAATISGTRIDLDWSDNSLNETGFVVQRCAGFGCTVADLDTLAANVTSYSDLTAAVDQSYTYRVLAFNNVAASAASDPAEANTLLPVAPSGLTATTLSATSVELSWVNNAVDATGFVVERCTGAGCVDFAVIDSTAGAVTTMVDGTVALGLIYEYQVRSRNVAGLSTPSASATASTVVPNAPSGLVATTQSDSRIDLSWADGSSDETGFYIDRCTGAACTNFVVVDSLPADVTAYQDLGLTPSLTYGYRVRAFNAAGAGSPSDSVYASTNLPAIPTDLSAIATTLTQVDLAWTDNASDEDGYSIERCAGVGCSNFAEIAQTASNAAVATDATVVPGESYTYRIRAFNGAGNSDYSNTATTTTALPAPPSGLTAMATSTTSIDLTWNDASDNETRFVIERCGGLGCVDFAAIDSVGAGTATFTDATVTANNFYRYRVSAANAIGASPASNIADAHTIVPLPPTNLVATTFSATQVDLTWDDNATNEDRYEIERCVGAGCVDFAPIDSATVDAVSYGDLGLTPNVTYRYRVRAVNGAGASAYSDIAEAATDVPNDPSDLTVLATSATSIRLDWVDNATNETDFVIQRCTAPVCNEPDFSDLFVVGANVVTYTDGTVALGMTGTYRVKAINLNGSSRYTNPASAIVAVPAEPTGFSVSNLGGNAIGLLWNDDATNETGYEIERCSGLGCADFARIDSLAPNTTSRTDASGALDATYVYRLRGINHVGVSPYTVELTINTNRPAAPSGLTATTLSASQVDLAWADNADNEQGYEIERCTGAGCSDFAQISLASADAVSFNDLTVVVGEVYSYRVRAYNIPGTSSYAGPATASTLLPTAPTSLAAVVSAPTEITLSWSDASDNEDGFRIERCSGSGCNTFVQIATVAANEVGHVDGGLNGNTFYRYRVRAFNAAGVSAYTAIVSPNTFAPAPPTGLTATTVFSDRIDLNWTDASSNETGFRIERCAGGGCSDFVEVATVAANVASFADATLSFGLTYRYRIRSYNGVANSAYTATVDGNTNVPNAPTGLAAAAQSTTRIDLTWTDNGVNETGYRVERCAGVGCSDFTLVATLAADATSHSDTPIAENTSFSYRVIATNEGQSDPSNTATATTILPNAPSGLAAVAVAGDRVDLSWTDNADNEYGTQIERCDGAACSNFALVTTTAADATEYSDVGLAGGVVHRYRIRTVNGAGTSAYTTTVEATTNVPGIPTALSATTFDAGRIDLAWTDNASDELGYVIERCIGTGCTGFAPIDSVETPNATAFSNTGLAAATTYRYRVRAYNASGVSGVSNVATAGTNVPVAPSDLAAVTQSASLIALTWTDNADNEGAYTVERCTGTACTDFAVIATLPIDAASYNDASVVVNTAYRYRVRASNNAGPSEYSAIVDVDTDVPATPTNLTATTISATRIDLAWTDAADNEVSYRVERCTGAGCSDFVEVAELAAGTEAYTNEPLTPNESYSYRVRAVNPAGASAYSTTVTATTAIPADPSGLSATTVTANRIDLSWTDNSSNETGFLIQRCDDPTCAGGATFSTTVGADVTAYSDEGVTVGNLYGYRVFAQSAAGTSGAAEATGSTLLPGSPVASTIVISASDAITITWTDASDNEDGFAVERCRGVDCTDFAPLATLGAGVTELQDGGLDVGVSYSYRIRATNAAGSSDHSATLTAMFAVPDAASKAGAATLSATQALVTWQDNSLNETGFLIERCEGPACGTFAVVDSVGTDVTSIQFDDLVFDRSYSFRIIARNPIGNGAVSDTATTTTMLADPASGLTATTVAASQINLGWSDNSTNESGFRIERCAGAGCTDFVEVGVVGEGTTGYADGGLSLNVIYVYRVRPFNAVGPSAYTAEATANTLLPADPTAITATPITVNRIDLTWVDNSDNEDGMAIEGCIGSGCTNFSVFAAVPANSTSYSYTSATANQIYRVRVRAVRAAVGSSGFTTSGDVSTVLNAPSNLRAQTVLRNRVDISWIDNTSLETSYQVLFCAGAGCTPATLAANLPAGTQSFQHTGLSQSQTYSWRVRAISNSTIAASLGVAGAYTPVSTGSGTTITGITDTLRAERYYVINVPAGTPELRITQSGGSGEADLHVRYGAAPTTSVFDCRPYPIGNEESCVIPNPAAGDWYFMPHAYQAITGVSVKSSLSTRYGYPTAFAGSGGWSYNYLIGQQLFISQNITLTHMGLHIAGGTGGVRIGLYTNVAGMPGTLITQTAGTIGTTGMLEFPTSAVSVTAGTYWLLFNFQNTMTRVQDVSGITTAYIPWTYGPALPASFGVGSTCACPLSNAHVRGYP